MTKEIDHEYTKEIICPWCGFDYSECWAFDDEETIQCEGCEKHFEAYRHVDVTYHTKREKCIGGCEYSLEGSGLSANPYISGEKNWTIWTCKTCHDEVIKTGSITGHTCHDEAAKPGPITRYEKPYIIPLEDPQ